MQGAGARAVAMRVQGGKACAEGAATMERGGAGAQLREETSWEREAYLGGCIEAQQGGGPQGVVSRRGRGSGTGGGIGVQGDDGREGGG